MTKFLKYFAVFALAALLVCGLAFTACGGKSDDEKDDGDKDVVPQTVTYTVTFEYGNGDAAYTVEVDEGATVTAPADPARDGYMFTGWYSDAAYTTVFDFSAGIAGDTTVYAGWLERNADSVYYTYMWNYDGAGTYTVEERANGTLVTSLPAPEREGYKLKGWYTEPECTNVYSAGRNIVSEDMTLYALWYYGNVFEAEYTNLDDEWDEGRDFSTYSDNLAGTQAIFSDASCSNGHFVVGMFKDGSYMYFEIESDTEVTDAMLYFSFAAPYGWGTSGHTFNGAGEGTVTAIPDDFAIMVNDTAVNYGSISFDVSGLSFDGDQYTAFQECFIGNVHLNAGKNIIVLETTNTYKGEGGTQFGFSPYTDCMTIYTNAGLTWNPVTSNLR